MSEEIKDRKEDDIQEKDKKEEVKETEVVSASDAEQKESAETVRDAEKKESAEEVSDAEQKESAETVRDAEKKESAEAVSDAEQNKAAEESGEGEEKASSGEDFEQKIEKAMEQILADTQESVQEASNGQEASTSQNSQQKETASQAKPVQTQKPTPARAVPPVQKQPIPDVQPPEKTHKAVKIEATLIGAIILCGIGGYAGMSYYYSNKFFPGTTINSFDCSDLTVSQAEELIRNKVEDYSITVASRGYEAETITAESIGYKYKSDGSVKAAFEKQKPYEWIKGYFVKTDFSAGENITYDKEKVKAELEKLECMQPENQVQPKDAYITFEDTLFTIVPGEEGSAINEDKALELLCTAIDQTEEEVDLDKGGAYLEPNIREDDESIQERLKIVNTYAKASITHTYGDTTETLDSKTFKDWYSKDQNGDLYLDGEVLKTKLKEYVTNMAYAHNTLGATRTFHTTSGRTVEVSGGNYGWQIDQYSEVEKMYNEILTGQQVTREPVYASTANEWVNGSDIGNTYIEVDLSEQHMYFYRDGKNIFESDFVSGNMSYDDRKTPTGVCHIAYKTKDFTLRGEKKEDGTYEYEEPVKYWMPFNGGVGFHDAPWRSEFGGDIYLTSGSHGCINMPASSAAQLYDLIDESIPIVVFY